MQIDGARRDFDLQLRLQAKPSGAAVLMLHDPVTLAIEHYRLLAGPPGEMLPELGDKAARHSKGDSTGFKSERPALRRVAPARFDPVQTASALVDRLFGSA